MKLFAFRYVILLAVLATHSGLSLGQNRSQTKQVNLPHKIRAFLGRAGEKGKPGGTFTGEVVPLPGDLRKALEFHFYLHRFTIVGMRMKLDITSKDRYLIVVTDAKSGEVVSHVWELGDSVTESFKRLLTAYPNENGRRNALNLEWAKAKTKILGDLLLYPYVHRRHEYLVKSRVGEIYEYRNGKVIEIRAELIPSYFPRWLLIVEMEEIELGVYDLEFKFGRLSIVHPESNEIRR